MEKSVILFSFFIYFIIKKTSLNILDMIKNKTHLIIRCVFIFLSSKFIIQQILLLLLFQKISFETNLLLQKQKR